MITAKRRHEKSPTAAVFLSILVPLGTIFPAGTSKNKTMDTIVDHCSPRSNHRVYTVELHGTDVTVTVTAAASVVRRWLSTTLYLRRRYRSCLVVGLGVQWTPGERDPPADTLQVCIGCRCLIFQLAHADYVPVSLRRFLLNPDHTFVGFWNHSDRRKLEISGHSLEMYRDPLDLRKVAVTDDGDSLAHASVEEIVEECLGFTGVSLRRDISMSDWDDRFLRDDQVLQACADAHYAFLIGKNYKAWMLN